MNISRSRVIALISGGTGDSFTCAQQMRSLLPEKMRVLLVEFACTGLPQLAYHLPSTCMLQMDRWLLELDHHLGAAVTPYLTSIDGQDVLAIPADARVDQSVLRSVREQPTLVSAPLELRQQLEHAYDVMIWICQGSLIHPMTYSALRVSDAIVWTGKGEAEERMKSALFRYLHMQCGCSPERLYAQDEPSFSWVRVYDQLAGAKPKDTFTPAAQPERFDPQAYRRRPPAERHETRDTSILFLTEPEDEPSGQLTFGLSEVSPRVWIHPSQDSGDLQLYLQVKQLLCEKGIQSANRLVAAFGVRRSRVLLILQQLAAEGMIETMGRGRAYGMKWTPHQCKAYLAHTQPVPAPVPKITKG